MSVEQPSSQAAKVKEKEQVHNLPCHYHISLVLEAQHSPCAVCRRLGRSESHARSVNSAASTQLCYAAPIDCSCALLWDLSGVVASLLMDLLTGTLS